MTAISGPHQEPDPQHWQSAVRPAQPQNLAPTIVALWRLQAALSWGITWLVSAIGAMIISAGWRWIPVGGIAVGAVVWIVVVPRVRHRRWTWQVDIDALELRYGIVVERRIAVPYFRIQQIDVTRGPLERLLDLASIEVTTASASGAARLPGIRANDAVSLRAELIDRARAATAEVEGDSRDAV